MSLAIQVLMDEHRLIERLLSSFQTFVQHIRPSDRGVVRDYADFFRHFADSRHHRKEEDLLFARMNAFGIPRDTGPIAVMRAEHLEGRAHVGVFYEVGTAAGPLTNFEIAALCDHAAAYIPLLRNHIRKEDNVLFHMADRTIPPDELDRLAESFRYFDSDVMSDKERSRIYALVDQLTTQYPPEENLISDHGHR